MCHERRIANEGSVHKESNVVCLYILRSTKIVKSVCGLCHAKFNIVFVRSL